MDENYRPITSYPQNNPFDPRNQGPRHAVSQTRSWNRNPPARSDKFKSYFKNNFGVIVTGIIVACILIGILIFTIKFTSDSSSTIQVVRQPATASQVAKDLNCTKFKDTGPAQAGGSIDTGYCFIGTQKYAINTFASVDVRDAWLKMAEPLGVNPKWETETSVTYKSVPQSLWAS
jgi:hypothetical protein